MNEFQRTVAFALCAGALLLAGCASMPAPVLLALPSVNAGLAPPVTGSVAPRLLLIRGIELPEYLLTQRVRYRADDSTLAEWPRAYWAERIETGVRREFGAALRRRLLGWQVCEASCNEHSPALALQSKFVRMDYVRGERRLMANVRLLLWSNERPPRLLGTEELVYAVDADADTPQSHARSITVLLSRLAGDVTMLVGATP